MSDTGDGQEIAEGLDDAQLVGEEAYPGDEPPMDYPPDEPLGVDEPQTVDDAIEDSVSERAEREEPDVFAASEGLELEGSRLLGDDDRLDDEVPVLAEDDDNDRMTAAEADAGPEERPAEEQALHVIPESEL